MPITIQISGDNAAQAIRELTDLANYVQPAQTSAPKIAVPAAPVAPTSNHPPGQAQPPSDSAPVAPVAATPQAPAAPAPTAPAEPPAAAPVAPAAAPQPAPVTPTAPTSVPEYDFNQLATATMQLQQAGHNIFELFQQFSIQALNQLPKERYGEYAAALRQRGAKI